MSYTDYVAHVQTDIIHDHFMRRLNHQLPEARLFNEPSVEAFWIERTKGRHSVDWDVAFGMTYNVLEESQQRLARYSVLVHTQPQPCTSPPHALHKPSPPHHTPTKALHEPTTPLCTPPHPSHPSTPISPLHSPPMYRASKIA